MQFSCLSVRTQGLIAYYAPPCCLEASRGQLDNSTNSQTRPDADGGPADDRQTSNRPKPTPLWDRHRTSWTGMRLSPMSDAPTRSFA